MVVTGSAAKGWTQTWTHTPTWTQTQNQTQHGAVGGRGLWDEHVDGPPVSCLPAPAGIMAPNKSLLTFLLQLPHLFPFTKCLQ